MGIQTLPCKKIWVGLICLLSLLFTPCSKIIDSNIFLHASNKQKNIIPKGESDHQETPVTLKVHRVGRGNAVTMRVRNGSKDEYMLVDVGSSGYVGETLYSNEISEIAQSLTSPPITPLPTSPLRQTTPSSILRSPNYEKAVAAAKKKGKKPPKDPGEIITNLRKTFLEEEAPEKSQIMKTPIHVKTVVITHPDADHYRWLTKLFSRPEDKIDHLIFGGQPNHYYSGVSESGREPELSFDKFKLWISARLASNRNMKVYFPAVSFEPLSNIESIKRAMGVEGGTKRKEPSTFGPPIHDTPEEIESFKEAFDFGTSVRIHALTVNPMHHLNEPVPHKSVSKKGKSRKEKKGDQEQEAHGEGEEKREHNYYSQSDPDNDNNDSLVLKISNGKSSAILTGDATSATTSRILANYSSRKRFLNTNILLASHHGSSTHGSNHESWIKATNPEYVIISNGHDGHPQPKAYQNFKQSTRLRQVKTHNVLVGGKTPQQGPERGRLHTTVRGIFSTLNSGSITVQLYKDGTLDLTTENEDNVVTRNSKLSPSVSPQAHDQKTEVDIITMLPEEQSESEVPIIILSPSHLQQINTEPESPYFPSAGIHTEEKGKEREGKIRQYVPIPLDLSEEEGTTLSTENKAPEEAPKMRKARRKKAEAAKEQKKESEKKKQMEATTSPLVVNEKAGVTPSPKQKETGADKKKPAKKSKAV